MTVDELIYAFNSGVSVMDKNDITYQCVQAIILRKGKDGTPPFYQGELLDKSGRAVAIVAVERIRFADTGQQT